MEKTITIDTTKIRPYDLRNFVKRIAVKEADKSIQLYRATYMSSFEPVAKVLSETEKAYLIKVNVCGFYGSKTTKKTTTLLVWFPKSCCKQ